MSLHHILDLLEARPISESETRNPINLYSKRDSEFLAKLFLNSEKYFLRFGSLDQPLNKLGNI